MERGKRQYDVKQFAVGRENLPTALEQMGFDSLRAGQEPAINSLLCGMDTILLQPTGSGKSAVYIIPTITLGWKTVVFSPLKSLIYDQWRKLVSFGCKAGAVSSGMTKVENDLTLADWEAGDLDFLLVAPERMNNPRFLEVITKRKPDMVVVDECFTGDVEVLTDRGFVRFDALADLEVKRVAQFDQNSKEIEFVANFEYIEKDYSGNMCRLHSNHLVDLDMTGGHELLYYTAGGTPKKVTAQEVNLSEEKRMYTAAGYTGNTLPSNLPAADKFKLAFQADGSWHSRNLALFSFTKKRKLDRFLQICAELGLKPNKVKSTRPEKSRYTVNFGELHVSKILREVFDVGSMSRDYARAFLDEVVRWDGSDLRVTADKNMLYYSSCVEDNSSLVQEVSILAGFKSRISTQEDVREVQYKTMHRVFINLNKAYVGINQMQKHSYQYSGKVFCVRVPKGNIVVRRSGKPLVIGNCHAASMWGYNFRESYQKVGPFCQELNPSVILALSATMTPSVVADVKALLGMSQADFHSHYYRRSNLLLSSDMHPGTHEALGWINSIDGPVVVYFSTVKELERVAGSIGGMVEGGYAYYHGSMPEGARESAQNAFMSNDIRVVFATKAFGLGVDKPDIRGVMHYSIPDSLSALMQECVHPDSMISTSSGISPAYMVDVGEKMLDYSLDVGEGAPAMVEERFENKADILRKVKTKLGSTLRLSRNHPVFVLKEGELEEVPCSKLQVGDRLLARRELSPALSSPVNILDLLSDYSDPIYVGVLPSFVDRVRKVLEPEALSRLLHLSRKYDYSMYKCGKHGRLDYWLDVCAEIGISRDDFQDNIVDFKTKSSRCLILPKFVTPEMGWWFGVTATDGYVYRQNPEDAKGYGSWKIKFTNTNKAITDKFTQCVSTWGLHSYVNKESVGRNNNLGRLPVYKSECSHPLLVHLCSKAGIPSGAKSYTVTVPNWLKTANPELRAAFIAGVVDGDGAVGKGQYSWRLHSASWDFLSGICMLLRGFGIPATCYTEDYTCKADVMLAKKDHGYSLRVSSTVYYEKTRDLVDKYSCKKWLPLRAPNVGQDMTAQRGCRRVTQKWAGEDWLVDEVLDISEIEYNGRVLNWRIEPGNKLVVDGVLTHNCGRGGRDGGDCHCMCYFSSKGLESQKFLNSMSWPPIKNIQAVLRLIKSNMDADGSCILTNKELFSRAGVPEYHMRAVMSILQGHGVLERQTGVQNPAYARIMKAHPDKGWGVILEAVESVGYRGTDGLYEFDVTMAAEEAEVTSATFKRKVRVLNEAGYMQYFPPSRSKPIRFFADPGEGFWEGINARRDEAELALQQVVEYTRIPDKDKHAYLEEYFESVEA